MGINKTHARVPKTVPNRRRSALARLRTTAHDTTRQNIFVSGGPRRLLAAPALFEPLDFAFHDCRVWLSFVSTDGFKRGKEVDGEFTVERLAGGVTLFRASRDEPRRQGPTIRPLLATTGRRYEGPAYHAPTF